MYDPVPLWLAIGVLLIAVAVVIGNAYYTDREYRQPRRRRTPTVIDRMPYVPGCGECNVARQATPVTLARHLVREHGYDGTAVQNGRPHDA